MVLGFKSAGQHAADARSKWWARMSAQVQAYSGRPLMDVAGRFGSSDPAQQRAAVCDAMTEAYAGDFRHVPLVRGLARQVAVRDVDNLIAGTEPPRADQGILEQRKADAPAPVDIRDSLRQAAAEGFTEALGHHLRNPDVARTLINASNGPGPQTSPLRIAATAIFSEYAQAVRPEQHQNAIAGIQQAMEIHARMIDDAAQDLYGHSGLPPRAFEQTLLETRILGSEIAGTGIEAAERLAHPPTPIGVPIHETYHAVHDTQAAQNAASSGVIPAGSGQPGGAAADPRLPHHLGPTGPNRKGAREV